jgi:hypothetical protein
MQSRSAEDWIQYLWVDALCIFQDEESHWLKQSSQTSHTYGNSTVTITSVDTDAVTQSFLKPRDLEYVGVAWKTCAHQDETEKGGHLQQIFYSHSWPVRHDSRSDRGPNEDDTARRTTAKSNVALFLSTGCLENAARWFAMNAAFKTTL